MSFPFLPGRLVTHFLLLYPRNPALSDTYLEEATEIISGVWDVDFNEGSLVGADMDKGHS